MAHLRATVKSDCHFFFHFRPLFQGSSSVDQLVEIVTIIGLMTTSDFEGLGIDESYALADVVTKEKFSPSIRESNFAERFQVHLGLNLEEDVTYLFQNLFSYIPNQRWDAEQSLQYIQWIL